MHLYPGEILPQEASPAGVADEDRSAAERSAVVRLVREGPVPKASCPHCGGSLQLSTVGSRWQVRGPRDVGDQLILQLGTLEREELHVLVLNARNVVIDQVRVYQGNVSSSIVRIGELFRRAVELHASAIIISHNHPSGDTTPSADDLRLTSEALAAGRLLDIALLDHVIVASGSYVSLRDRGVEFGNAGDHRAGEVSDPRYSTWHKADRAGKEGGPRYSTWNEADGAQRSWGKPPSAIPDPLSASRRDEPAIHIVHSAGSARLGKSTVRVGCFGAPSPLSFRASGAAQ
jgi:hypothetical protein